MKNKFDPKNSSDFMLAYICATEDKSKFSNSMQQRIDNFTKSYDEWFENKKE